MCCRYWTDKSPEIREIVEEMNKSPLVSIWQRATGITAYGEIKPTNVAPVIASDKSGQKKVYPMKWGFTGQTPLLNARVETAPFKATFREAWASHRCIVPATCYYDWQHITGNDGKKRTGEKYIFQPRGSSMTWLCGLYRIEDGLPVFVILTREASEEIRSIHDRMPLIMPEEYVDEWIRPDAKPEELLDVALTGMVYEKVAEKPGETETSVQLSLFGDD